MVSTVLFIGSVVALLGGVLYLFIEYHQIVVDFFLAASEVWAAASELLPSWLLPFIGISFTVAAVSLIIRII